VQRFVVLLSAIILFGAGPSRADDAPVPVNEVIRKATAAHGAALREQERCEQANIPKLRYDAACEATRT
jgi:hypothetical protein